MKEPYPNGLLIRSSNEGIACLRLQIQPTAPFATSTNENTYHFGEPVNLRMMSQEKMFSDASNFIDLEALMALFDKAPDVAFFVKDLEGRYTAVNDSLVERHGLQHKTEALGKRPIEICQGEFGEKPSEQDQKVLSTGQPLIEHLEMHWQRPNKPIWCLTTKLPLRDAQGKVCGLVGFSRDVRVTVRRDDIPEGFAKALAEFESTLSSTVTPAWFAERSNMSPSQFNRFAKRLFGLTPTQIIAKVRIAGASRMLAESDKSVAEIALACGFYDHSAFSRAFRSATGVPPTVFRKQNQQPRSENETGQS